MIGRQALMERVWSELTKRTPSNLSLVGPRYIGKTVFLKALATRARQSGSPYSLVLYWDLGHATPQADEKFISDLSDHLREVMGSSKGGQFAEHRNYLDHSYGSLREVTDLLDSEGVAVLMLWDGLDKPLGQGHLTGHLFGQMRDLFHGKRHKIVTAARATQSELARNKQVYDSEFWNLFDIIPVRFGAFDATDVAAAVSKTGLDFSPGGLTELRNWTEHHPLLLLTLLNGIGEQGLSGPISAEQVNSAARDALDLVGERLKIIWEKDCSAGTRDLYRILVERGEQLAGSFGKEEADCLLSHGFARQDGRKLKPACRLLEAVVRGALPDAGTLSRLFGAWENYRSEVRNVLELRLQQVPVFQSRLHRLVKKSIEDIPDYPDDCLNGLTQIEEMALDVVWDHELGQGRKIPADVVAYWTEPQRRSDAQVARLVSDNLGTDEWRFPSGRGPQIGLLQLLTGSKVNFDSKSKYISKYTYVLLNAIHSFRNRSEHPEGQRICEAVAVAAMMTCVELLGCLARDLSSARTS
jgi:hypothetical protein